MDNPHPLETLGDSGAYGPDGSISRYHNPDHYTRVRSSCLQRGGDTALVSAHREHLMHSCSQSELIV